jgi:hypothetical protein
MTCRNIGFILKKINIIKFPRFFSVIIVRIFGFQIGFTGVYSAIVEIYLFYHLRKLKLMI